MSMHACSAFQDVKRISRNVLSSAAKPPTMRADVRAKEACVCRRLVALSGSLVPERQHFMDANALQHCKKA